MTANSIASNTRTKHASISGISAMHVLLAVLALVAWVCLYSTDVATAAGGVEICPESYDGIKVSGIEHLGLRDAPSGRYVYCAYSKLTKYGEEVKHLSMDATVEWIPDDASGDEVASYCALLSTRENGVNPNGEYRLLTSENRAATVSYGWSINDAIVNANGSFSGPIDGSISSPPQLEDIRSAVAEPLLESVESEAALCGNKTAPDDQTSTTGTGDASTENDSTDANQSDVASSVPADDNGAALAIAGGLILALLGGGSLISRVIGKTHRPQIFDADGNELIVQDGSYQGGKPGQVWYGGQWVDPTTAITEIEKDHQANVIRAEQDVIVRDAAHDASDQWTKQWIERNEHEAMVDHATRANDAAEIQQILTRGRAAYLNLLHMDTAYNHALGNLYAQDGADWGGAVDRTEFIQWVADRGVDTLAGITPGGKGIKAVYSLYKGIGSGMSESLYANDFHSGLGTVLKGAGEGFTDIALDLVQDHVKLPFRGSKYDFSVEKLIERALKNKKYLPSTGFNIPAHLTDQHAVIKAIDAITSGSRGYFLEDLTWKNGFKENVLKFDREYLLRKITDEYTKQYGKGAG